MMALLTGFGAWPLAIVLAAIGVAGWWIIRLTRIVEETRRALVVARDAAEPIQLETPTVVAETVPDPDLLPMPICVFSSDGRPERVNRSFMAWHGAGESDGFPEKAQAIARLRLLAARRALEADRDPVASGMFADTVELETAQGRLDRFSARFVTIGDTTDGPRWCLLSPMPGVDDEAGLGEVFQEAPIGVALIDLGGRISAANATMAELADRPGKSLAGLRLADFVREEDRPALASLVSGGGEHGETELRMGEAGSMFVSAFVRRAPETMRRLGPGDVVIYMIDISSRRDLEERMIQSQKMQAVGQLAGGIAHDFNNLLTAMTGFCDLLMTRHRSGDPSFADIMQIKQNANRAANLVRQLLAFSRQQTLIPRVVDVTETIADLSHLLRRLIGEGIDLRINHGRGLKPIMVDQSQLEQVVVNLIVNARDAMDGQGTIQVRTYNVHVDRVLRRRDEVMPVGEYVLIEVNDSGSGISPENLDRVFEPFFSTKDVGAGTGLGLSTVYGIVKQTSGFIFVESVVDEGAKFSIYLPAHDGRVERGAETADADQYLPGDLTGVGTILLVEDEDPVRLFAARALRGKGYLVIEARSAENALATLRDGTDPIDLLITDVMMPGMDGPTLIREMRAAKMTVPIICISGYSEDALRQRISEDIAIYFLSKPFSLRQLAGKVKEVMRD
jgi:two-component system, cell cycle sensor histidine kinase and response regulator CckA